MGGNMQRACVRGALLTVILVGCARAGSASPSLAPLSPSSAPQRCGDVPTEICDLVFAQALRHAPPGSQVTGIETEPFAIPSDQCDGKPCPPFTWPEGGGIVLSFADRPPLHLVCQSGFMGQPGTPERAAFENLYVCGPLAAAEQRTLKLHTTVNYVSASEVNFYTVSPSGVGGGQLPAGSTGGCGSQLVGLPFSFVLTDSDPKGLPTGHYREVFRSEEIALPEGEVFLKITVTAADRAQVEQVDPIRC